MFLLSAISPRTLAAPVTLTGVIKYQNSVQDPKFWIEVHQGLAVIKPTTEQIQKDGTYSVTFATPPKGYIRVWFIADEDYNKQCYQMLDLLLGERNQQISMALKPVPKGGISPEALGESAEMLATYIRHAAAAGRAEEIRAKVSPYLEYLINQSQGLHGASLNSSLGAAADALHVESTFSSNSRRLFWRGVTTR